MYAVAEGGWFGVGLGEGRLKWGWLPNGHNDFIFAVIAEELGVVGCLVVIGLLAVLAYTGLRIARRVGDPFRRLVGAGITIWLVGQAAINIGGVIGLLPITGLPLPFISDGGSALVVDHGRGRPAGLVRPRRAGRGAGPARPSTRQMGAATLGATASAAARARRAPCCGIGSPRTPPASPGGAPPRCRGRCVRCAAAPARERGPGAVRPAIRVGARGAPDGWAAVGGTGGRRDRRAHLSAAGVRGLPAAARPRAADHLRGYGQGAGDGDHSTPGVRPAAGPGLPAAPLGEPEPDAYPGPDVALGPRRPRGTGRGRGGRRRRLRRLRLGTGVPGGLAAAHAHRHPRGERARRGGEQAGHAVHQQHRGRLPVPDGAGTGAAQRAGSPGYRCAPASPPWTGRPGGGRPDALRAGPGPADAVRLRRLPGRPLDQPGDGRGGQGDHRRRYPGAAHHGCPQRAGGDPGRTSARPT